MADISKITLPSGTVYDIKDAEARSDIADLKTAVTGAMHYIGITTTALTDGSTTATIVIDGTSKTLTASDAGAVAIYQEKEFVWNGTKWQEFGSTGSLKALAFKDTASATYTPAGTVSQPTFSGSELTSTGTLSVPSSSSLSLSDSSGTGKVQVATDVTTTFSGNQLTSTGTLAAHDLSSVLQKNVNGSGATGGFFTVSTSLSNSSTSVSTTGTPTGSVSAPTISVKTAGSTTTVNSITNVGTLPSFTATVSSENLSLGWSAGTLPTKGSNTTVKTGDAVYQATAPTFTGDSLTSTGSISVPSSATTTLTPKAEQPTSGTYYKVAVQDSDRSLSVKGTPSGTVTPTVTKKYVGASLSNSDQTVTVKGTPAGTVSKPTFSGTQATITVS